MRQEVEGGWIGGAWGENIKRPIKMEGVQHTFGKLWTPVYSASQC